MAQLDRLALFIDYQNAYKGARTALGVGDEDSHIHGQFDPVELARLLARRQPSYHGARLRQITQVSIYRGLPGASHDSVGYGATRRQIAKWRASCPTGTTPQLDIHLRPLDYSLGSPREKGIDVLLALDLAFGAANDDFDVVMLFSGDSDLLPALERAHSFGVSCETVSWQGGRRHLPRKPFISWEHKLTELDYSDVEDVTDYR